MELPNEFEEAELHQTSLVLPGEDASMAVWDIIKLQDLGPIGFALVDRSGFHLHVLHSQHVQAEKVGPYGTANSLSGIGRGTECTRL